MSAQAATGTYSPAVAAGDNRRERREELQRHLADGRSFHDCRPAFMQTGPTTAASGSAYAEFGKTKVIVSVRWQVTGLPCTHALCIITSIRGNIEDCVHESSTPTRPITSVSTPSPLTRSRKRMLELEGNIEPVQFLALSPEPAHEKGKPKKLKVVRSKKA